MAPTTFERVLQENITEDGEETPVAVIVGINVVLFVFVAAMTSSVNLQKMKKSFTSRAVFVGLFIQFFIAPVLGFATVKIPIFDREFSVEEKVVLLTIMSSPGGTVSNLICSLFNSDLGLSVTMSAISTLAACVFLPFNVFLYVKRGAGEDAEVGFLSLSYTVMSVVFGVLCGMFLHTKITEQKTLDRLSRFGNFCGFLISVLGIIFSQNAEPITEKSPLFALGVFIPAATVAGISMALSFLANVEKPATITVIVEAVSQNTQIANAMALGTFPLDDALRSLNVSVMYQLWSLLITLTLLTIAMKNGWALSPASEPCCKALCNNYQPGIIKKESEDESEEKAPVSQVMVKSTVFETELESEQQVV